MVDAMDIVLTDEGLPNERSDEVVNAISGITESTDRQQLINVSNIGNMLSNVLVTTASSSQFFSDQEPLKATRIIIHNPSLDVIKNAQQTITFNPLNRSLSVPEKNTISFDPSVYDSVLPVRCKTVRGELHKNRFGSGNRGRSILCNNVWYTPSEFESLGGRGHSKDWKRSVRYGGRTLLCLIEQGILRPHATSCTCSACCEDAPAVDGSPDPSSGPVRLFTPYKRKKRQNRPKLKVSTTNVRIPAVDNLASAPAIMNSETVTINSASSDAVTSVTVPSITRESGIFTDSVIVVPEPKPLTSKSMTTSIDFNEQKQWWQIEEMVKNAVRQILDLQKQVDIVKNQCALSKEAALQELKTQMEEEKKEALNTCRLEAQIALSRAILKAKNEKEMAVQDILEQSRIEMAEKLNSMVAEKVDAEKHCANCDRESFSDCTGCHRVSYCSAFCQRKDWISHKDECGAHVLDPDCSELIDDCDDSTN